MGFATSAERYSPFIYIDYSIIISFAQRLIVINAYCLSFLPVLLWGEFLLRNALGQRHGLGEGGL